MCHFYYLKMKNVKKGNCCFFISKKAFLKNHKMSNLIHHIILMNLGTHLNARFRMKVIHFWQSNSRTF